MKKKFFPLCHILVDEPTRTTYEHSVMYGRGHDTPGAAHDEGKTLIDRLFEDGESIFRRVNYSGAMQEILIFDEDIFYHKKHDLEETTV